MVSSLVSFHFDEVDMATVFNTSGRTIIIENVTHAQISPDVILLYPANYHVLRIMGEEMKTVTRLLKDAGFLGDASILINPNRVCFAEEGGAIARLILDGYSKALLVSTAVLTCLNPQPAVQEMVSSAGNPEPAPARKKKNGTGSAA